MMENIGILIISHSLLADSMVEAVTMVMGKQKNVYSIGLTDDILTFSKKMYEKLDELFCIYDNLIVCADLKGGTPYNQAYKYKLENNSKKIFITTGFNFAMLIEMSFNAELGKPVDELLKISIDIAKEAITNDLENSEENNHNNDDII